MRSVPGHPGTAIKIAHTQCVLLSLLRSTHATPEQACSNRQGGESSMTCEPVPGHLAAMSPLDCTRTRGLL
jgi:hypothetical protein